MKTIFGFLVAMMFVQTVNAVPAGAPKGMGISGLAKSNLSEPMPTCPIVRTADASISISRSRFIQKGDSWDIEVSIVCTAKGKVNVVSNEGTEGCTWPGDTIATCESEVDGKKENVHVFGTIGVVQQVNSQFPKQKVFGIGFYKDGEIPEQQFTSASTKSLSLQDLSLWVSSGGRINPPGGKPADAIGVHVTFEDPNALRP